MWKHQDLLAAKDKKPLSLFPGVAVGPAALLKCVLGVKKTRLPLLIH